MSDFRITGIVPVLPAPFLPDEELDLDSLRRMVGFAADQGFSAACLPAYATEFYKLSIDERYALVGTAVEAAEGRIPIVGQSNHYSAKLAAAIAKRNAELGASAISVAVPRLFAISEEDIFRFLATIAEATPLPLMVQDFNPGGATVSAALVKRLNKAYPHFRYLKLEEPLMAPKVAEILAETGGAVQVLEGWGGMYLLEGISAGVCGAMPGLSVADLLQEVYDLAAGGDLNAAMDRFERVLPQIVFSLQNLELFLYMEKLLLVRRSLLSHATVRAATLTPDPDTLKHVELLAARVLSAVNK